MEAAATTSNPLTEPENNLLHENTLSKVMMQEIHDKMQQERVTLLSGFVPLDSQTFLLLQMENWFFPCEWPEALQI